MVNESTAATSGVSQTVTPTIYRYQTMEWNVADFGDGWETLSDADVQSLLAAIYPELNNARTKVETTGEGLEAKRIVTFERAIGTKGTTAPADGASTNDERLASHLTIVDPRPRLLWDAIAALPPLELQVYELAYDMQRLTLDDMLARGDTLEAAIAEADREIAAVTALTRLLIPLAQRASQ